MAAARSRAAAADGGPAPPPRAADGPPRPPRVKANRPPPSATRSPRTPSSHPLSPGSSQRSLKLEESLTLSYLLPSTESLPEFPIPFVPVAYRISFYIQFHILVKSTKLFLLSYIFLHFSFPRYFYLLPLTFAIIFPYTFLLGPHNHVLT